MLAAPLAQALAAASVTITRKFSSSTTLPTGQGASATDMIDVSPAPSNGRSKRLAHTANRSFPEGDTVRGVGLGSRLVGGQMRSPD